MENNNDNAENVVISDVQESAAPSDDAVVGGQPPKKRKHKKGLIITFSIIGGVIVSIATVYAVMAIGSTIVTNRLISYAKTFDKVEYSSEVPTPVLDDLGHYSFTTDNEFKVMQLTDIHIGSGIMSREEDQKALNAIACLVSTNKPDLVVFTGDQAFPVPYISGTLNNERQPDVVAHLMETLGVYWTAVFGNHDSEAYNYFNRDSVKGFYTNFRSQGFEHCLFNGTAEGVSGSSNNVITVKGTNGVVKKALITMDSNAYLSDDPLGIKWHYDNIHADEIAWYEGIIDSYTAKNKAIDSSLGTVESLLFFHIPLPQYQDALFEYKDNGFHDTADTKYLFGECGEDQSYIFQGETHVVWSGMNRDDSVFDSILNKGSTKAIFVGHDHLNNFAFEYKGIKLVYGMSIDYLAYSGIQYYGRQRGCTNIDIASSGAFTINHENYYLTKFSPKYEKETVTFNKYYSDNTYLMDEFNVVL